MTDSLRAREIPSHPIRLLFRSLTERGMSQIDIRDEASIRYVSALLGRFIRTDEMYRMQGDEGQAMDYLPDMYRVASATEDPGLRMKQHQYLGDLTLFMLGIFPEALSRRRSSLGGSYYVLHGKHAYGVAAELVGPEAEPALFRRLAEGFDAYVAGLNWVRLYIRDPFFQYMFREFHIS